MLRCRCQGTGAGRFSFVAGRTDDWAVDNIKPTLEQRLAKRAEERAAPVMAPMEEQASKRAAQLGRLAALPEHLRLGVMLPGMRDRAAIRAAGRRGGVGQRPPGAGYAKLTVEKGKDPYPENVPMNLFCPQCGERLEPVVLE